MNLIILYFYTDAESYGKRVIFPLRKIPSLLELDGVDFFKVKNFYRTHLNIECLTEFIEVYEKYCIGIIEYEWKKTIILDDEELSYFILRFQ